MPAFYPSLHCSITALNDDVLKRIAISCISTADSTSDVYTIVSMARTCRRMNLALSIDHNYDIYGEAFCALFDTAAAYRRLGSKAMRSSSLAAELKLRLNLLKRIRSTLAGRNSGCISATDLCRLYIMVIEDDGNNLRHLHAILDESGLLVTGKSIVGSQASIPETSKDPLYTFLLALYDLKNARSISIKHIFPSAILICRIDDFLSEAPNEREEMLDLLEPYTHRAWVLGSGSMSVGMIPLTLCLFGNQSTIIPPTLVDLARIGTIGRYYPKKRSIFPRPSNTRSCYFDEDWNQRTVFPTGVAKTLQTQGVRIGSCEGIWRGALFIPCRLEPSLKTFMCAENVVFCLREYVCVPRTSDKAKGKFTVVQEEIYASGWSFEEHEPSIYQRIDKDYNSMSGSAPTTESLRTLVVGETILGDTPFQTSYIFTGYVDYGTSTVFLSRKPKDTDSQDLGIWILCGRLSSQGTITGDWKAVSATDTTASASGWFHVFKNAP
ncbi:hypothetical protein M422DRAFT_52434 [Sphaerobolus stellatus SS14]|uniref:Uncharacterized protein n=1 Tax=Sphaerobolus stellatus (strain SS14) TaxID=990650 RepID=A0A0C9V7P2_SPHS4|nr:hypothetical protein M422DRAFT_52434 [Sphaerobolus stellatus SS14]